MSECIYLAGPMQGYPNFNFPAFHLAAAMLRAEGHYVFNPAERDIEKYGEHVNDSPTGSLADTAHTGFSLDEAMDADCHYICRGDEHGKCTMIALLPNYEYSSGASVEYTLSKCLKRKFRYISQQELDIFAVRQATIGTSKPSWQTSARKRSVRAGTRTIAASSA